MSYIKVKNNNHLVRNTESNCIINTNKSEYEQYLARKKHKQNESNKVGCVNIKLEEIATNSDKVLHLYSPKGCYLLIDIE